MIIVVTGATGAQGGAAAKELLAAGFHVRALVRDPTSAVATALSAQGVELVTGDMDNPESLQAAMIGAQGVFSVQIPDSTGTDSERRHGANLVKAAIDAGVSHFVHTSVCEAGRHEQFPRWESGCWSQKYWTDKWDVEEMVRHAGFAHWTILKPAFMLDNFAEPKASRMFPHLREGKILTALNPSTAIQVIAADDVGKFARAAFEQPEVFNRKNIDMAAQALTMAEVAEVLTRVTGCTVVAQSVSPDEAIAAGLFPGWVRSQEWTNEVGYRADIAALKAYGIPLLSIEQWLRLHLDEVHISPN